MKSNSEPNLRWGFWVAEQLFQLGLRQAVITPGSRNTPLVIGFIEQGKIQLFSHYDERSAGFFALGLSRSTKIPSAVICTSGTAVANLAPAVVEACYDRIPLLICTADRPPGQVYTGANQTIFQSDFFGYQVRHYWSVGLPQNSPVDLCRLLTSAWKKASGITAGDQVTDPPGPVHLNFPFAEPLYESLTNLSDRFRQYQQELKKTTSATLPIPSTADNPPKEISAEHHLDPVIVQRLKKARNPMIVVGGTPVQFAADSILELAAHYHAPVLADPRSGLRYGPQNAQVIAGYDLFLPHITIDPDLVLRFGTKPVSKTLGQLLDIWSPQTLLTDPSGRFNDDCPHILTGDISTACNFLIGLTDVESGDNEWLNRWQALDQEVRTVLKSNHGADFSEPGIVSALLDQLPAKAQLIAGNSRPIRDLDDYGLERSKDLEVFANRGASGIDGIISTAAGICAANPPASITTLLIGDLSFFHDMNGLYCLQRHHLPLIIVLLNNGGGGIFEHLPIHLYRPEIFDQFWKVTHTYSAEKIAQHFGIFYDQPETIAQFRNSLSRVIATRKPAVLELMLDGALSRDKLMAIREEIFERLQTAGMIDVDDE